MAAPIRIMIRRPPFSKNFHSVQAGKTLGNLPKKSWSCPALERDQLNTCVYIVLGENSIACSEKYPFSVLI